MFIHDSDSPFEVPELADEDFFASNDKCATFRLLSYVDGNSIVRMSGTESENERLAVAQFSLISQNRAISLSDHSGFVYASVPLVNEVAKISITANDLKFPERIAIQISEISSY